MGNIPIVKETEVANLTAISIAADSEKFPTTEDGLLDADLINYIPIPWRTKKSDARWASTILALRSKVAKKSLESLQSKYIDTVKKMPLYGHHFFYVRKEMNGADMICSVSHVGLTFLSVMREELEVYKYGDLHRWGGSSTMFWVLVYDRKSSKKTKLQLYTSQARDLSSLILDYAVLAADKAKSN